MLFCFINEKNYKIFSIYPQVKGKKSYFLVPVCMNPNISYHFLSTLFSSTIPILTLEQPNSFAELKAWIKSSWPIFLCLYAGSTHKLLNSHSLLLCNSEVTQNVRKFKFEDRTWGRKGVQKIHQCQSCSPISEALWQRGFAFRCGTFAIVFVVMRIKEQNKSDETKVCRNGNICFSEAVTFSYWNVLFMGQPLWYDILIYNK